MEVLKSTTFDKDILNLRVSMGVFAITYWEFNYGTGPSLYREVNRDETSDLNFALSIFKIRSESRENAYKSISQIIQSEYLEVYKEYVEKVSSNTGIDPFVADIIINYIVSNELDVSLINRLHEMKNRVKNFLTKYQEL